MKTENAILLGVFIGVFSLVLVESLLPHEGHYKHQVLLPMVCDEYLTVKKPDVPIGCYDYFGIK